MYHEIYHPKPKQDAEDFLENKDFGTEFRVELVIKKTENSIQSLKKRMVKWTKLFLRLTIFNLVP